MLVFVTHPYHRGGVTSWIREAFLYCTRQQVEAAVVTVKPRRPFISGGMRPAMTDFIGDAVRVFTEQAGTSFELGTFRYRVDTYIRIIRRHIRPGAVLIPSDDDACWAACCTLAREYPVVGVLHSDDPHYYQLLHEYGSFLAGVVAVSKRVLHTAAPALPACVIPCGINLAGYESAAEKEPAVIWVGRVEEEQKRAGDIIPIAQQLLQDMPAVQLHVYGHGDRLPWLRAEKERLKLHNLCLHGWQEPPVIAAAMGRAAVLLQTSNYEGMSVAVMEALAAGCAIVSTRVSGVEDLEREPAASAVVKLYNIGDTAQAAQYLRALLQEASPAIAGQAREVARQFFSIDQCVQQYLQFSNALAPAAQALAWQARPAQALWSRLLATLRYIKYKLRN